MEFKIRDKRDKGWFWVDNDYLNGYARYFGPVGTSLYIALCRHAHLKDQVCYPTQEGLAIELGMGVRTVKKYIKIFEQYRLIKIEHSRDVLSKKYLVNIYVLLDKSEWVKPSAPVAHGLGAPDGQNRVHHMPHKETHQIKRLNFKERYKIKERYKEIGKI